MSSGTDNNMMGWINSFYSKLVLGLLGSFLLIGLLLMFLVQQLTIRYQNEVEQKLHLELAAHVVGDDSLLKDGEIDQQALEHAFHSMMILGPSFEFYVLTPDGTVTTYSAEDDKIKRMAVDLKPIKQFLSGNEVLPIVGDDPRSAFRQKIFSVAEIRQNDRLKGYLYIIIGGEIYDSTVDLLKSSHIIKLSFWGLFSALLFSLVVVLLLFAMLTRPLRQLTADMKKFRSEGFDKGVLPASDWDENSSDEIQRLGSTFNAMASTLKQQYEKVRTTDELRRELISYVSHDLRTPLTRLRLGLSMLDGAEVDDLLRDVDDMQGLLDAFLDFARNDAGDSLAPASPREIVDAVVADAKRSDQRVYLFEATGPSELISLRPLAVRRALDNLVGNALRYGSCAEVSVSVTERAVKFTVEDDGPGIPAQSREAAMSPFVRLDPARNQNKGTGVGLGLSIVADIARTHGGLLRLGDSERLGGLKAELILAR